MRARVATLAGLSLAGVLLTGGAVTAAPHTTTAPSVAGTTQTIYFQAKKSGGYKNSASITFAKKTTFKVPEFSDKGKYTDSGSVLTLKVTKSNDGDVGCSFTGNYDPSTTYYSGSYTCPGGYQSTFAVTTSGS